MSKVIKGRGKILFYDEKDREKMNKKYPELDFEKMNALTFTTTYKGNKQFEVEIQVEDTKIPCSIQKWAWPWKYGTKVELRLYFKDLKKKAITHITGGIQHELFRFFRYDYEKMIKDDPKLNKKISKKTKQKGGKQTRKKSKKDKYISNATLKSLQKLSYRDLRNLSSKELQKYKKTVGIVDQEGNPFRDEDLIHMLRKYISGNKMKTKQLTWRAQQDEKIKQRLLSKYQKAGKQKKKTFKSEKKKEKVDYWKCVKQNENTQKCNTKRSKTLKYLENKYPKEWSQYQIDFQTNPKLRY